MLSRLLDTAIKTRFSQREAYNRAIRPLYTDLGWSSVSGAERLLIEQVVICYVRMQIQELHYTAVMHDNDGVSLAKAEHQELRQAQARYLRSIETLARVRHLLLWPRVNINLPGGQQENIAGDVQTQPCSCGYVCTSPSGA